MGLRVVLGIVLVLGFQSLGAAQTTTRVSVSSSGSEATQGSNFPSISTDGRFVAFLSSAADLIAGDTNGKDDVFVHDLQSGTTTRVSVDSSGAEANNHSYAPSISGDGRYIAFGSSATNLVAVDTNGTISDVFLHDRQTGVTKMVTADPSGLQANQPCENCVLSADGRYVAFNSSASNLIPIDTNGTVDVFRCDVQTGVSICVSVSGTGLPGSLGGTALFRNAISADGRFVAFQSISSDLVAGDSNGMSDAFVRDCVSGSTVRSSRSSSGVEGNAATSLVSISADGRFVGFTSLSSNLVAGDTNGLADIFVYDTQTGLTEIGSVDSAGVQGTLASQSVSSLSADGRFISFQSSAPNLVPGDTNGVGDIFVRDRLSGTTSRVNVDSSGSEAVPGATLLPTISHDGRFVAFRSAATNLVAGDTNGVDDIFVHDRGVSSAIAFTPFCAGDGSSAPCPCGNESMPGSGAGCLNSTLRGGELIATGIASISADALVLLGSRMPNGSVLYFQGTMQVEGGAGSLLGDGLVCAGGVNVRLGIQTNTAGASQYPGPLDVPISLRGSNSAGYLRMYQAWYRDAMSYCTPSTFNLTNGVQLLWVP